MEVRNLHLRKPEAPTLKSAAATLDATDAGAAFAACDVQYYSRPLCRTGDESLYTGATLARWADVPAPFSLFCPFARGQTDGAGTHKIERAACPGCAL